MKRLPFPLELLKKYRREGEVWRGNRQGFPLRATITRPQATEGGEFQEIRPLLPQLVKESGVA